MNATHIITGQDIQEAYNDVLWPPQVREDYAQVGIPLGLRTWQETDDRTKNLYNQLADRLNKVVAEQSALIRPANDAFASSSAQAGRKEEIVV